MRCSLRRGVGYTYIDPTPTATPTPMIEDRLGQDNAYNHLEQLTEVEDTVSYTYDANGNRATMVSKVNEHIYATTAYSYNLANMVVSMTNDPSNESAQTFAYTYYLDGNQRTKTEGTKNYGRADTCDSQIAQRAP